ncbi:MAG: ammonium transporter, partial [Blastocatellia bacterium]|nr:ammonium transporter [Blastocatellia bacterium]
MKRLTWSIPFLILVFLSLLGVLMPVKESVVKGGPIVTGDVAWMLTAAGLVLLMTPGLSFFYGGMVRLKNVISTMLQSFIALGVISILWVFIVFILAFCRSVGSKGFGFIGSPLTYLML